MNTILSRSVKLLVYEITGLIFLFIGIHCYDCAIKYSSYYKPPPKSQRMCGSAQLTLLTMSEPKKELIVDTINKLRNKVAYGNMDLKRLGKDTVSCVQGRSMTVMQWDDELAEAAKEKVMVCDYRPDARKFGQFKAKSIFIYIALPSIEFLKTTLEANFLLTDDVSPQSYDSFKILVHHSSLFIGCAMAKVDKSKKNARLVCYIALSEKYEHKMLYQAGPPCLTCPFRHYQYFSCDSTYNHLCKRPPWGISDNRTQSESYLEGYEKYKLAETVKH